MALTLLDQIRGREISEHRVKQMLQPEAINAGNGRRALFVPTAPALVDPRG